MAAALELWLGELQLGEGEGVVEALLWLLEAEKWLIEAQILLGLAPVLLHWRIFITLDGVRFK